MACDPTTVLAEAGCISCLSVGQQQAMIVKLLCEILKAYDPTNAMATCDPQTILDDAKCLSCLQPQQLLAMTVRLLCDIKDAIGGGTGTGCVVCVVADPVDPPTNCDCAIAVNTTNDELWYWNGAAWVQLTLVP